MTVCVGVPFSTGIVLAADTQVTATTYKDYAPKLGYTGGKTFCVGMAGSGYLDLLNHTIDSLSTHLAAVGGQSPQSVQGEIQTKLTEIYRGRSQDAKNQQLLSAISVPPAMPRLVLWRKDTPSEEGVTIIGCGDVELTRFLKSFVGVQVQTEDEALHWAIYLVWRAKKFVVGCGGDTGALIITDDAKVEEVAYSRTRYLETYLEQVEQEMAEFTSRAMFSKVNRSEFSLRTTAACRRLWEMHEGRFKDFT